MLRAYGIDVQEHVIATKPEEGTRDVINLYLLKMPQGKPRRPRTMARIRQLLCAAAFYPPRSRWLFQTMRKLRNHHLRRRTKSSKAPSQSLRVRAARRRVPRIGRRCAKSGTARRNAPGRRRRRRRYASSTSGSRSKRSDTEQRPRFLVPIGKLERVATAARETRSPQSSLDHAPSPFGSPSEVHRAPIDARCASLSVNGNSHIRCPKGGKMFPVSAVYLIQLLGTILRTRKPETMPATSNRLVQ